MARILFMSMVACIVDLLMVCVFVYVLAWGKGATQAGLVVILAGFLHALLTPTPEARAELHAFLRIPQR